MNRILLASKSPRRLELITYLGVPFLAVGTSADESFSKDLTPQENVMRAAANKAKAAGVGRTLEKGEVLLGVDTVVVLDGEILFKPKDYDDARRMITKLSGKHHSVLSGVAIISTEKQLTFYESSIVEFAEMTEEEILGYIGTDEPYDKAGAYAVQGLAAKFIRRIEGCYYNIMGFPLQRIYAALRDEFHFFIS